MLWRWSRETEISGSGGSRACSSNSVLGLAGNGPSSWGRDLRPERRNRSPADVWALDWARVPQQGQDVADSDLNHFLVV